MSNFNKENEVNVNTNVSNNDDDITSSSSILSSHHHGGHNRQRQLSIGKGKKSTNKSSLSSSSSAKYNFDGGPLAGGSDAASSYFFSDVPKTPAVKKELKRQRRELRLQQQQSLSQSKSQSQSRSAHKNRLNRFNANDGDASVRVVGVGSSADNGGNTSMNHTDDGMCTGELNVLLEQSTGTNESMLLSPVADADADADADTDTDIDANATMASTSTKNTDYGLDDSVMSDALNKSVLSDTTELTASNYVFAAASRHRLEESKTASMSMSMSIAKLVEGTKWEKKQEESEGDRHSVDGDDKDEISKDNDEKKNMMEGGKDEHNHQQQQHAVNQSIDTMDISKLLNDSGDSNASPNSSSTSSINNNKSIGAVTNETARNSRQGHEDGDDDHTIDTAMLDQFINLDDSTDDLRNESMSGDVGSVGVSTDEVHIGADFDMTVSSLQNTQGIDASTKSTSSSTANQEKEIHDENDSNSTKSDPDPEAFVVNKSLSTSQVSLTASNDVGSGDEIEVEVDREQTSIDNHNVMKNEDKVSTARKNNHGLDLDDIWNKENDSVEDENVAHHHGTAFVSESRNVLGPDEESDHAVAAQKSSILEQSPFVNTGMKLNIPFSLSRRRRSRFGDGEESEFQQSARRTRAFTASIQKARKERESMKKRRHSRFPRSSLASSSSKNTNPSPAFTPIATLPNKTLDNQEQKETVESSRRELKEESVKGDIAEDIGNQAVNTTVDFGEHKINEILGDLVTNNDSADEQMEHATPEKLNMSILQDPVPSVAEEAEEILHEPTLAPTPKSAQSRTRTHTPSLSENETLGSLRVYIPSPARHTRSRVKKRKSAGLETDFESLPLEKRPDHKHTPQTEKAHIRRMSMSSATSSMLSVGEDDTQAYLEYVVPYDQDESREEKIGCKETGTDDHIPFETHLNNFTMGLSESSHPRSLEIDKSITVSSSSEETRTTLSLRQDKELSLPSSGKSASETTGSTDSSVDIKGSHNGKEPVGKIVPLQTDASNLHLDSKKSAFSTALEPPSPTSSNASSSSIDTQILLNTSSITSNKKDIMKIDKQVESNSIQSRNSKKRSINGDDETGAAPKSPFIPPSTTKSRRLNISSPLSGDESDEEDFDIDIEMTSSVSPSSSTSSDMTPAIDGDDGDTANSQDLRDIMAELDEDDDVPTVELRRDKRRRSSNIFQLSLTSDTQKESKSIGNLEVATADTQDIKGLFSSLERQSSSTELRTSSLLPIEENTHYGSEENLSEGNSVPHSPDPPTQDYTKLQTPKSILKKKRGDETSKRNVVFYPPVAAEYNVGSPPANFTPLCTSITKTLFTIPRKENELSQDDSTDTSASESFMANVATKDETVDLESNLIRLTNAVVDDKEVPSKQSCPSPALKPANDSVDNGTATLEAELTGLLNVVAAGESGRSDESSLLYDTSISRDGSNEQWLRNKSTETRTMELETKLVGMLSHIDTQSEGNSEDKRMMPLQKILSSPIPKKSDINRFIHNDESASGQNDPSSLHLNESNATTRSGESMKDNGMTLLSAGNLDNTSSTLSSQSTSEMSATMNTRTTELDVQQLIEGINKSIDYITKSSVTVQSNGTSEISLNSSSSLSVTGEGTMTLEYNMKDMPGLVDANKNNQEEGTIMLEQGMSDMLGCVASNEKEEGESSKNIYEEAMSFGEASMLHSSASGSITEDFRLLQETNGAPQESQNNSLDNTTLSLRDNSILQKSEGDNIELETNIQGLVGNVSDQEDMNNSGVFADVSSASCSDIRSINSSQSETNKLMRSMERMIQKDDTDGSSTGININISSIPRDSGTKEASTTRSSDMSSAVAKLFQESDPEKSTGEIQEGGFDGLDDTIDLKWQELVDVISGSSSAHTESFLTEAEIALKVYNHPSLRDQARTFIIQAIEEVESRDNENIDPGTLLIEVENLEVDLLYLQKALRGQMGHLIRSKNTTKLRALEDAACKEIEMDVVSWETLILEMLQKSMDDLSMEAKEDMMEIEEKLKLSHQAVKKATIQFSKGKKVRKLVHYER